MLTATGKVITKLHEASPKDVDEAVAAAQKAFDTVWGLNISGFERGKLLMKLADIMDERRGELASIESLDNGSYIILILTLIIDVHI
jgi:aldehyde dehydrogenase (NAD+)